MATATTPDPIIYEPAPSDSATGTARQYRGKNPVIAMPVVRDYPAQVIAVQTVPPEGYHFTGTQLVIGAIILYLLFRG